MSDPLPFDQLAELRDLIFALHDQSISPEDSARLEQWICQDEEACRVYVQYMHLYARLYWDKRQGPESGQALPRSASQASRSPLLGFLADAFEVGTDFLSRGLVISLLLTIGLPVGLLVVLLLNVARQPMTPAPVAAVTRMRECVWSENSSAWRPGADVYADQRLELHRGLVEITFARGAKVLLEGPATFTVAGDGQGVLRDGSLVATVKKGAEGFTIQTPALAVVDLGTEFGVRVEDEKGTGDIEVFQGKVELRATARENPENTLRQFLSVGQAARIEVAAGGTALPTVRQVARTAGKFVRQMPVENAIVADFSGGVGNTRSDQFPGTAGSGWATGWSIAEDKALSCVATIEESSPLLGGGEYLRVLVERRAGEGGASEWTGIDRRLALADVVDLTKPHVVSFNLRIDSLDQFTGADDRLSICARNVQQSRFVLPGSAKSSWHICMVGQGGTNKALARSKNWYFLWRDDNGQAFAVDSGITPREGSTYSFRVLVDPPARRWTPSIAVDGGKWTQYEAMGMRSKGSAKKNGYWPFLHLFCQLQGNKKKGEIERIGFSVDSIRVTSQQTGTAQ